MSTEENQQTRARGLRRGRISGPWAYLIVATPVVLVLYALAVLVSTLT